MKALTVLLILLTSLKLNAQKILQYELMPNDTFRVEQLAKQQITQDINGEDQVIDNRLLSHMFFKVIKVEASLITLEMQFEAIKMTMSSPSLGELLHTDTAATDDLDLTSKMFKGALNIPITLVMEKTGKIQSVSGGEQLITSMFKAVNITDAATIAESKPQFEKQFGSKALSSSFEQITYFLPAKVVQIGEVWENEFEGNLKSKNKWALTHYTETDFTISGVASTTMSSIDDNVVMSLQGTQNTTINANSKTGLFKTITVEGTYSGLTQVTAADMNIPTTITSTITYHLLN